MGLKLTESHVKSLSVAFRLDSTQKAQSLLVVFGDDFNKTAERGKIQIVLCFISRFLSVFFMALTHSPNFCYSLPPQHQKVKRETCENCTHCNKKNFPHYQGRVWKLRDEKISNERSYSECWGLEPNIEWWSFIVSVD